jgi:predicted GNAT family acetyltransferase
MTFDEYVEKNTESKEVKPDNNNKKSKRHHKTNLSIERTEYDDSIRKKGIYRILDDKLAGYITECQTEAELLRKER